MNSVTTIQNLTLAQVLKMFSAGPNTGTFTDGSCYGNPGPGGWGAVFVKDGKVVEQAHGHDKQTTNNRMELTALIAALKMVPANEEVIVYTDSNLCVQTINDWAPAWKARGWKRKTGPIANLELVQELFELSQSKPKAKLTWIKAHNHNLWNEYADSLANAWAREIL
ncbi:MAG: ribonuclease H [bacterium]|nr:ribonuclease H [bacterium]